MKKLSFLVITLVAALVFACNKNMKVVKELDGTWNVKSVTVNGVPDSSSQGMTVTFEKCKVKKEDCDGSYNIPGFGTIPFTYNVTEKGTKYTIKVNFLGQTDTETGTITEHSDSKVVFTSTEDGETMVTTLVK